MTRPNTEKTGRLRREVQRWGGPPRGATAVEYLVILVLAAMVVLAGLELFAGGIGHQYENFVNMLQADMGRESAEEEMARRESARASSSSQSERGPSAGRESGEGRSGRSSRAPEPEVRAMDTGPPPAATGSVGGVNPIIWLIALGLILALGYVMFGEKKG